jgi:hypothetical protein
MDCGSVARPTRSWASVTDYECFVGDSETIDLPRKPHPDGLIVTSRVCRYAYDRTRDSSWEWSSRLESRLCHGRFGSVVPRQRLFGPFTSPEALRAGKDCADGAVPGTRLFVTWVCDVTPSETASVCRCAPQSAGAAIESHRVLRTRMNTGRNNSSSRLLQLSANIVL